MLIFACAISGILDFLWITSTSTPGILVFNALFGFASGSSLIAGIIFNRALIFFNYPGAYVSVFPASISSLSDNAQNIGYELEIILDAIYESPKGFGWACPSSAHLFSGSLGPPYKVL
jgi:hypothetical protein